MTDLKFAKWCKENNMFMDCEKWFACPTGNWHTDIYYKFQIEKIKNKKLYNLYPNPSSDEIDEVLPEFVQYKSNLGYNHIYELSIRPKLNPETGKLKNYICNYFRCFSGDTLFDDIIENSRKECKQKAIKELKESGLI